MRSGAPLVDQKNGSHHSVHCPYSQQGGATRPLDGSDQAIKTNAVVACYTTIARGV